MIDPQQAMAILAAADLVHSADRVAAAVNRVAREISERLRDSNPVLLCVMQGGVPLAGQLMTRLTFPLEFDYVHVGRYGQATSGGVLSGGDVFAASEAGQAASAGVLVSWP